MPIGATIGAGALAAGGAVAGAKVSSKATNRASAAATQSNTENNAILNAQRQENIGYLSPYVGRGEAAGGQVNDLLGIGGDLAAAQAAFDRYRGSTGYDFRKNEGLDALNTGYAARGLIQSGAAMKGIERYGQDYGSNEFSRYLDELRGQQQTGLSAGNALAGVGTNIAGALTANNDNLASVRGNAAIAGANGTNAAIGQGLNALGQFAGLGSSFGSPSVAPAAAPASTVSSLYSLPQQAYAQPSFVPAFKFG